jgi:glycosyltransferase involved in cell wall biosynthesis
LLITDDASTDNTLRIIEQLAQDEPRILMFSNPKNLKLLKTRNKLLEIASGDFITFQDADDYSDPQRLELMVNEFKKNPRLGVLASQVAYVNEANEIFRISNKPLRYKEVLDKMYDRNVVGGSIMMMRKEALQAAGGKFREYFDGLSYQDYDLSLLIAEKFEAYSLPQVLYYYRQHDKSASKVLSIDRLLSKQIVIHLAEQRRAQGTDDIIEKRPNLVDAYFEILRRPYKEEPSLIYREYAATYILEKLYGKAIKASWNGVRIEPFKLTNWRTLQYCLRISFLKKIKEI